jgi:hypothetical protein
MMRKIPVTVTVTEDLSTAELGPLYSDAYADAAEREDHELMDRMEDAHRVLIEKATDQWIDAAIRIGVDRYDVAVVPVWTNEEWWDPPSLPTGQDELAHLIWKEACDAFRVVDVSSDAWVVEGAGGSFGWTVIATDEVTA